MKAHPDSVNSRAGFGGRSGSPRTLPLTTLPTRRVHLRPRRRDRCGAPTDDSPRREPWVAFPDRIKPRTGRPRSRTSPFEALRLGGFVSPVFPQKEYGRKSRQASKPPRRRNLPQGSERRTERPLFFASSREISFRTRRHRKWTHVRFAQDTAARRKDTRPTVLEWGPHQDAPAFWAWPEFGVSPGRWIVTLRA